MELSLAHEASQRTLKQRNLLALICIVLGILVVVMFTAASTRDREVVLQPILPSEMTLSSSSVTPEYLEAVTRDTAQLALNRSPETLQYWLDGIVAIAAPFETPYGRSCTIFESRKTSTGWLPSTLPRHSRE